MTAHPLSETGTLLLRGQTQVAYFSSLGRAEHLKVLEWQVELEERLWLEVGAHCSVNVHNQILVASDHRRAFLM